MSHDAALDALLAFLCRPRAYGFVWPALEEQRWETWPAGATRAVLHHHPAVPERIERRVACPRISGAFVSHGLDRDLTPWELLEGAGLTERSRGEVRITKAGRDRAAAAARAGSASLPGQPAPDLFRTTA